MTSAEERIKKIAQDRSLDEADAARLLDAVRPPVKTEPRRSVWRDPFARYGGEVTTAVGVVVAALGIFVSRFQIRFDGALDLHTVSVPVPLRVAIIDQLVAFPLTALVLWAAARVAARHVRFVDMLGVVGVARGPAVLIALPLGLLASRSTTTTTLSPALAVIVLAALAGLGSQIYLLVTGFRTASGLRGARLTWLFIGGLLLAETLSKLVLSLTVT